MIEVDLPRGTSAPLVRGLAACLASVTEVPLDELPPLEDVPAHALGAWRSWLAGRGSGLVPIADPRSFQWAPSSAATSPSAASAAAVCASPRRARTSSACTARACYVRSSTAVACASTC